MIWSGVLASRLRLARNQVRARGGRRALALGVGLFGWFFILVMVTLSVAFASLDSLGFGTVHAAALLAAAMAAALVAVVVFDIQYAVSAVLLDSDLELLRRAPLLPRELLAIKIVDSVPRTTAMIVAVALPACLAFATVIGLPLWGWALLPIVLAGLWATPLGAGLAVALMVVRIVPARRAREVLAVFSTLVMLALWMFNSFAMPRLLADEGRLVPRLIESLLPGAWMMALSPPHWAAAALAAAHDGEWAGALGWVARLLVAGTASLALAGFTARVLLDDVLARVAVSETSSRRRPARAASPPVGGIVALLLKDARLFTRDWAVLGDVLTAALLWTLLPLVAGPLHQAPPPQLARLMLVALAVGLGYEIGSRTLPYEGQALAWSRLAPVAPWRWNLAKWLGGALISFPVLVVATAVLGLALPLSPGEWWEAVAAGIAGLMLSLALGLWTGWTFGDPNWTNPRAMLTFTGRLFASGLLIFQAAAWIALLAAADALGPDLPRGALWWGPLALAVVLVPPALALAERAASRHEWTS